MKQVIPFYKEIVFKTNIASITSISLEHEENINEGEVSGDFIIFGDYKIHNDTTEKELFKYRLPFTALIPDEIDVDTVFVDVENFTFELIDEDVLRVDIDFSIQGEQKEEREIFYEDEENLSDMEEDCLDEKIDREIDELLGLDNDDNIDEEEEIEEFDDREDVIESQDVLIDEIRNEDEGTIMKDMNEVIDSIDQSEQVQIINKATEEIVTQEKEEYVTYHIHIVKENETLDNIVKMYNTSIDYVKEYNDITEIKIGDKVLIPEYGDE